MTWIGIHISAARLWPCALVIGVVAGCDADGALGDIAHLAGGDSGSTAGAFAPNGAGGGTSGGGLGDLAPEVEVEVVFEPPAVGARRVYSLNPATDRVAVVDAKTFAIESIEVGDEPDFAVTAPGQDIAVVLNRGSRSVHILRVEDGATVTTEVALDIEANRLAMAPSGDHVIAYFDSGEEGARATSFQDVSVVSLEEGKVRSARVTVGFRPSRIQFDSNGSTAFVVNEDGISIIDLAKAAAGRGAIARLVGVGDDVSDPVSTDVSVTPDGRYALARRDGSTVLTLVNLADGTLQRLDVARLPLEEEDVADAGAGASSDAGSDAGDDAAAVMEPPLLPGVVLSDADLARDGSFAIAAVRSHSQLLRLPVPGAFEDAAAAEVIDVEAPVVGSVLLSDDAQMAVVYTTASEDVESVTLVNLADPAEQHGVRLRKAVRAVALSEDATRMLVLHKARLGSRSSETSQEDHRIDVAQGYSVIDVPARFAKLQLTDALVSSQGGFAITPDASHLFVMIRNDDEQVRQLQRMDLSNLAVETVPLSAPPTTLGLVTEVGRAFVGQEQTGGMITFVDYPGSDVQTVTGFELSSRIRQ